MKEYENLNNKVKIKYYDRINKQLVEIEVDKSIRSAINRFNKREKRQKEKLKQNEVVSLDYLKDLGIEIESDDINEEKKELLSLEEKNKRKKKQSLYKAMRTLTARQREIINMRFYEKKSVKDIAEFLNVKENTISVSINRICKKLKDHMENH